MIHEFGNFSSLGKKKENEMMRNCFYLTWQQKKRKTRQKKSTIPFVFFLALARWRIVGCERKDDPSFLEWHLAADYYRIGVRK